MAERSTPMCTDRVTRYLALDRVNQPYLRWQLGQFDGYLGRRILEVGTGVGGILELLGQRELIYGIDLDPEVLDHAASRFRHRSGFRFQVLDIGAVPSDALADLQAQRFDTIVCINVLEHVRDDIRALQTMESVLVPGGILALLVPAHTWLYGAYDRVDGHWRRYSRAHLRLILSHTRFEIIRLHYFNLIGALGWWVQYRLFGRSQHGQRHFGLMNRLIPFMRVLEGAFHPPFGLSVVAVCRRPGSGHPEVVPGAR